MYEVSARGFVARGPVSCATRDRARPAGMGSDGGVKQDLLHAALREGLTPESLMHATRVKRGHATPRSRARFLIAAVAQGIGSRTPGIPF